MTTLAAGGLAHALAEFLVGNLICGSTAVAYDSHNVQTFPILTSFVVPGHECARAQSEVPLHGRAVNIVSEGLLSGAHSSAV